MPTESELLASLGVIDSMIQNDIINGTKRLVLLDASAHLDWDWLLPFPFLLVGGSGQRAGTYFKPHSFPGVGPAVTIFDQAAQRMTQKAYHYSICEIGFLRGFAMMNPSAFTTLKQHAIAHGNLRIAGGGITSPDTLLPHGETFIRNFLLGHTWLAAHFSGLPPITTLWIPDDFGHDPQLPVIVQAMGLIAAGFARVPGTNASPQQTICGGANLKMIIEDAKIDFTWSAADGSSIVAHWLIGYYNQGKLVQSNEDVACYLGMNADVSPTPYIYVPVLDDFLLPNPYLVSVVNQWNQAPLLPYTDVIAVNGSFEDYAQLVQFHSGKLDAPYGRSFNPNPYYTGCYGSRPEIKIRHQRASRNLLAAELFSIIASWTNPVGSTVATKMGATQSQQLFDAWDMLVPSTHHDYITGTAIPDVFRTEQLTLLRHADVTADVLLRSTMEMIAGSIKRNPQKPGLPVVVFNSLGFDRTEVVALTAAQVADASISVSEQGYQYTPDGGLLFVAPAPSLGYQTIYLGNVNAPQPPAKVHPPEVQHSTNHVALSNGLVNAVLMPDEDGVWGLTSIVDTATGMELIQTNAVANDLLFYADGGTEYQFGAESSSPACWRLEDVSSKTSNSTIEIIETGPLRVWVKTSVTYTFTYKDESTTIDYVREYILLANEPMLRMQLTGAAPMLQAGCYAGCSVVVAFPLVTGGEGIDTLIRGTPYHWTDVMPDWIEPTQIYWNHQTFLATHNFVIPQSSGTSLCALYHSDIPAWGIAHQFNTETKSFEPNNGVLYGCVLRNGDGNYFFGSEGLTKGTDPDVHVREYALRIPSSLRAADTGGPLREALAYRSPLSGIVTAPWSEQLPDTLSIASSSPASALITAVKPGTVNPADIVFRIYQPTNAKLTVTLTLDSYLNPSADLSLMVRGQTALEQDDVTVEAALYLQTTSTTITFTAATALTTLAVTP